MTPDQVAALSDAEVLERTNGGSLGAPIVGDALATRAREIIRAREARGRHAQQAEICQRSDFGRLGPAIIGDELHAQSAAHFAAHPGLGRPSDGLSHGFGKSHGSRGTAKTGRGRRGKRRK